MRAISPVIGTVLVLFIVLLAMAGILMWGVPAIQGLQEHAEFESMVTQSLQLNADLRTLRDPQNTRLVTISMSHGSLRAEEGGRWVITVYTDEAPAPDYSTVTMSKWELDTEDELLIEGLPAGTTSVSVHEFIGGAAAGGETMDCGSPTCTFTFADSLAGYRVAGNVTRVQFKVGADLKAEAWIFDAGRLTYRMSESDQRNRVHLEMGAVFTQQYSGLFLEETPTVKEPVWTTNPKDTSFLVRLFDLDNDGSQASGQGRHTVLANLIDNYGANQNRPLIEGKAVAVRIQIDDSDHTAEDQPGLLEEAFCNYFDALDNYTQAGAGACDEGDVNLLYNPDNLNLTNGGKFTYELSHADVRVVVRQH